MSGFAVVSWPWSQGEAATARQMLTCSGEEWCQSVTAGQLRGLLCRRDDEKRWGVHSCVHSGDQSMVYGRFAGPSSATPAAGWAALRADSPSPGLNGAALFMRLTSQGGFQLDTDRMGFIPVFRGSHHERWCVSNDPDLAATLLGCESDLDQLSLIETVCFWHTSHPNTAYRQVQRLDPGSRYRWSAGNWHQVRFSVTSAESEPDGVAAERLASALTEAVGDRVEGSGDAAVLLSAGLDSRAVLFAGARNAGSLSAVSLYDEENRELRLARRIAEAAGAGFKAIKRDPQQYLDNAAGAAARTSGCFSVADAHFGLAEDALSGYSPLLSGCYADYLFKGIGLNRRAHRVAGRWLPRYGLDRVRPAWHFQHRSLAHSRFDEAHDRYCEPFRALLGRTDETAHRLAESLRLYPMSREPTVATRVELQRQYCWDAVLADHRILDCHDAQTVSQRLNGDVWSAAVALVSGKAGRSIPDANWGGLPGASVAGNLMRYGALLLAQKLRPPRYQNPVATRGSWPHWPAVLRQSSRLGPLWQPASREAADALNELFEQDLWRVSSQQWVDRDPGLFTALLTAKLWFEQKVLRLEPAP